MSMTPFTCVVLVADGFAVWQLVQANWWRLEPCWPVVGRPVVAAPWHWPQASCDALTVVQLGLWFEPFVVPKDVPWQ
jgi:hypothetical protein